MELNETDRFPCNAPININPGGKGAGNEWGFDKKLKNWVKCPLVGHSKLIKCFKTDAPRG